MIRAFDKALTARGKEKDVSSTACQPFTNPLTNPFLSDSVARMVTHIPTLATMALNFYLHTPIYKSMRIKPLFQNGQNVTFDCMMLHFENDRQPRITPSLTPPFYNFYFAFLPPCYIPGVTPEGCALRLLCSYTLRITHRARPLHACTPYACQRAPLVRVLCVCCTHGSISAVSPGM